MCEALNEPKRKISYWFFKISALSWSRISLPARKYGTYLPGTLTAFKTLSQKYKLVVATKGDLLDQERKLHKSGLTKYLHHIEIMSEKNIRGYKTLMARLGVMPQEFIMVGNSLKSDIMPVVKLGAKAVWIPYALTWQHENLNTGKLSHGFIKVDKIEDLLKIL